MQLRIINESLSIPIYQSGIKLLLGPEDKSNLYKWTVESRTQRL